MKQNPLPIIRKQSGLLSIKLNASFARSKIPPAAVATCLTVPSTSVGAVKEASEIILITPMIGVVEPISGGGGGNHTGNLSLSGVIGDVSAAGSGFFKIGTKAFDFMLSMPLCFLALGCGFCFTALGLARKALRASKRS